VIAPLIKIQQTNHFRFTLILIPERVFNLHLHWLGCQDKAGTGISDVIGKQPAKNKRAQNIKVTRENPTRT